MSGCNTSSCSQYIPGGNSTYGVQMKKEQFPYPATGQINAPSWSRDLIMYDFEDVCTRQNVIGRYSTGGTGNVTTTTPAPPGSPPGTAPSVTVNNAAGFGYMGLNRGGANAGKLYQTLGTTQSWWEEYRNCVVDNSGGGGQYSGAVQKTRYWEHYPSQISFEPIFSDTWFYYQFDTANGVTGNPCHVYCFTVTYNFYPSNGGRTNQVNYTYNVVKRPYVCPCPPDETYIRYALEDGLTNPSYNSDPYPTFWSIGTKRNGIAFRYSSGAATTMLYYQPRDGQERYIIFTRGAPTQEKIWTRAGMKMFGKVGASNAIKDGAEFTQNVTFSNGMVLNMTFTCHRGKYGNKPIGGNANTFVKLNSIVTPPTGGFPTSGSPIKLELNPTSPFTNTQVDGARMGFIWIYPTGTDANPDNKLKGVPIDFMLSESRFEGGLYAVSHPGWTVGWFNSYAVWTNNKQNNLAGREMTVVMRKIPVAVAGTYTLRMGIDNSGSFILDSWGRTKQEDEEVLSDADENREIPIVGGFFDGGGTTTFTTVAPGYINITCNVQNGGTNTSWSANPGGFAAQLTFNGQTVWTTRDQINQLSFNGGDGFRGMTLKEAGFVDAWNGSAGIPFRSAHEYAGTCWNTNGLQVYKDYKFPGGLKIRMLLQSEFDQTNNRYNTIWRIYKVLNYGKGYQDGDGVNYIDQNKFTLYYPNKQDPNRISVTLLLSKINNDAQFVEPTATRLAIGSTVNGFTVKDVRESSDNLNMHYAELANGTADFTKDQVYTASNGAVIKVCAGFGIKDRAVLIGLYEFRKKEIEFGVGIPTEGMPFSPDLIRPQCAAVITNGRVTGIDIISRGRGLQNKNVRTPQLVVSPPPTYFNSELYETMVSKGFAVDKARRASKGTGTVALLQPIFKKGKLDSVNILDGGSGYSSTAPPDVYIPNIVRVDQQVVKEAEDINKVQSGAKEIFEKSEPFKKLSSTQYDKPIITIDSKTGNAKVTGTTKSTGYSWNDYSKASGGQHAQITYPLTRPDVNTMTSANTKRSTRYEDRGVDKKFAQNFKTGSKNHTKDKDIKVVTTKKLPSTPTTSLPAAAPPATTSAKGSTATSTTNTKVDANQYIGKTSEGSKALQDANALPNVNPSNAFVKGQLKNNDKASSLNYKTGTSADAGTTKYAPQVSSKTKTGVKTENSSGTYNYSSEFKSFLASTGSGNLTNKNLQFSNMDWSKTAGGGKATQPPNFKPLQSKTVNSKTYVNQIEAQEKKTNDSFDEMWQRDEEANRTGSWYNTEMRVVKQSFFNLPCRNNKEIYLMRRFCPDPRPWTTISVRLGTIKNPPDPNNTELTVCKKCLEDTPGLAAIRTQIRSQFSNPELDIEEAYCVSLYGLPPAIWYAGQAVGAPYSGQGPAANGQTYLAPFAKVGTYASSNMPSNTFNNKTGGLQNKTGYQQADTQVEDGCRSYEINGYLLIYHSLTNEARLWADSVGSYGNPYDFMCGRNYGDQGEEDLYSTEEVNNDENDLAGLMPGYLVTSSGTSNQSLTIPSEGY